MTEGRQATGIDDLGDEESQERIGGGFLVDMGGRLDPKDDKWMRAALTRLRSLEATDVSEIVIVDSTQDVEQA